MELRSCLLALAVNTTRLGYGKPYFFFLSIFTTALESQNWLSHSLCIVIKGRKWIWAAFMLKP